MKKAEYRSEVAAAVHEGVRGMHRLGLVDKRTMREFDVRRLKTRFVGQGYSSLAVPKRSRSIARA